MINSPTSPSPLRPRASSLSMQGHAAVPPLSLSYSQPDDPVPPPIHPAFSSSSSSVASSSSYTLDSTLPAGAQSDHANDPASATTALSDLLTRLDVEVKIADGAQHLLQLFDNDPQHSSDAFKAQVQSELNAANDNVRQLESLIEEVRATEQLQRQRALDQSPDTLDVGTVHHTHAFSALGLDSGAQADLPLSPTTPLTSLPYSPTRHPAPLPSNTSPSALSSLNAFSPQPNLLHGSTTDTAFNLPGPSPVAKPPRTADRSDARTLRRQADAMLLTLKDLAAADTSNPLSSIDRSPTPSSSSSSMRTEFPLTADSAARHHRSRNHNQRTNTQPRLAVPSARSPEIANMSEDNIRRIELMEKLVVLLKKNDRVRYEIAIDTLNEVAFPCLADSAAVEVRASVYRLLRHSMTQPPQTLLATWKHLGLDIYLNRSLLRDNRCTVEKEQALKLFRAIVEVQSTTSDPPTAPHPHHSDQDNCLTEGVVRAVIAISENPEDKLRDISLETLVELAIFNLPALLRAGGLGTILTALLEGPPDLAPAITRTLLSLADQPSTRAYLRPRLDVETALAGYTDLPSQKGANYAESLQTTAKVVTILLSSWTGLLYLCMDNHAAIRSLVTALRVSPLDVQQSIIAVLIRIFDAGLGAEASTQRGSKNITNDLPEVDAAEGKLPQSRTAVELRRNARERKRQRIGLVDQYLSLLLVLLIDSGLVSALVHIFETSSAMNFKATLLMSSLLHVGNRVLPQSYNVHFHQLPKLFESASSFLDPDKRQRAVAALSAIDRNSLELQNDSRSSRKANAAGRERSDSTTDDPLLRGHRQVEKVKMMMGMNMDDNTFRALLLETQVQSTRDHTKWNIDKLFDLLQGPLLNVKRLDEALRLTKLIRRLLSFFHPSERRFSELPATPPNRVYIRLASTLLSTLITSPEGVRFLAEDKLLREVREAFEQIEFQSSAPVEDPILAKSRITSTLSQGYFDMIGTLSSSSEGIKLLNRFGIWTCLYRLCQQATRDDLVRVMLEKLDYSIDHHPRILLGWTLSSASRLLRRFATEHLTRLIRKTQPPAEWMIAALLVQLCDPAESIRGIAVAVVKEVCASPEALEMVVSMRPTLDHLGETGHELLLRFLSTPGGLRYLLEGDYIDREMEEWLNVRNHRYAVQMEVNLSRALSIHRKRNDPDLDAELFSSAPPHFYGELAKTAEGCEVLRQKGHFIEFAHFIHHHGMEGSDLEVLSKLKSVLWTVGNIGATAGGFPFLEANGTVATIVDVAENSPVLSVRGVCFYVIGLISLTRQGAELLQDYGWQSACTTFGQPTGICIPQDLNKFCEIPAWKSKAVASSGLYHQLTPPKDQLQLSILSAIANLGNSILANKASRTLTKLKQSHPGQFTSLPLFVRALTLMDSYRLRQVIRRFIFDLFDIELNQRTVRQIQRVRAELLGKQQRTQTTRGGTRRPDAALPYIAIYRSEPDSTLGMPVMRGQKRRPRMDSVNGGANPLGDAAFEEDAVDVMDDDDDDIEEYDEEDDDDTEGDSLYEEDSVVEGHDPDDDDEGYTIDDTIDASDYEDRSQTFDPAGTVTADVFGDGGSGGGANVPQMSGRALFLSRSKTSKALAGGEKSIDRLDPGSAHAMRRSRSAQSGLTAPQPTSKRLRNPRRQISASPPANNRLSIGLEAPTGDTMMMSTMTMTQPSYHHPAPPSHPNSSIVYIDGFGERKGANWSEPPGEAPAPGVRIIGGFGDVGSNSGSIDKGPAQQHNSTRSSMLVEHPQGGGSGSGVAGRVLW